MADKYKDGKVESIRNPDGIWINSQVFREEANHFIKNGYYCPDPIGSPAWLDYWYEQRKRCIEGYSVGGAIITGEHYFYLNFCPMEKVSKIIGRRARKIYQPPDFWDGDYNFFWAREIAKNGIFHLILNNDDLVSKYTDENNITLARELFDGLKLEIKLEDEYLFGGHNMCIGKARRRGYSYKAASIAACNYYTRPNSLTIFGAEEKKYLYPGGVFSLSVDDINFINEHTGWTMPSDEISRQDHIKSSYVTYKNGVRTPKGFMSEIVALTFKDNPDAARGKDALDIFFEEGGAFGTPGLLTQAYRASEDCVKAGDIKTGMITIWGTSGDLSGGTYDFSEMFKRPKAFGLLPFVNIWDENGVEDYCGFFHPANLNLEGYYDEQGNSDLEKAKASILKGREIVIQGGATSLELSLKVQERPLTPSEAFASSSTNNYPIVELEKQKNKVLSKNLQLIKGTPVHLIQDGSGVVARPILDGSVHPITSLYHLPTDKKGCPIIYEFPIENIPKGLYKIGYDPIRQDTGTSLASIIVYKGVHIGSLTHSCIVAEYVGRPESAEDADKIAEKLAIFYGTQIMFENEVPETRNYFRRIKRLDLLATQPDAVISKNIKKSKVSRIYGCHMNDQLKNAGERYIKDWLLTRLDYDEHDNPVYVYEKIYSLRLLEELIAYHRKGNYDLHSSLIMCLIQVQEEFLGTTYEDNRGNPKVKKLLEMMEVMNK